jgi:hypothetical protein
MSTRFADKGCRVRANRILGEQASQGRPGASRPGDRDRLRRQRDVPAATDEVIYVPRADPFVQALLAVVPLRLLTYRIAQLRGLNVDQPRNLAETVTVA